jgi:4-carboxymuconolactone decarboxylase
MTEASKSNLSEAERVYESVPQLKRLREEVLMGDVWQQPELSQRDRSLVTCAILGALGRGEELKVHAKRAVANGVTVDELRGLIVQTTFYAGWPAGLGVGKATLDLLED